MATFFKSLWHYGPFSIFFILFERGPFSLCTLMIILWWRVKCFNSSRSCKHNIVVGWLEYWQSFDVLEHFCHCFCQQSLFFLQRSTCWNRFFSPKSMVRSKLTHIICPQNRPQQIFPKSFYYLVF